jgi:hypothetical protein
MSGPLFRVQFALGRTPPDHVIQLATGDDLQVSSPRARPHGGTRAGRAVAASAAQAVQTPEFHVSQAPANIMGSQIGVQSFSEKISTLT